MIKITCSVKLFLKILFIEKLIFLTYETCTINKRKFVFGEKYHNADDVCKICTCIKEGRNICETMKNCKQLNCQKNLSYELNCCQKYNCSSKIHLPKIVKKRKIIEMLSRCIVE